MINLKTWLMPGLSGRDGIARFLFVEKINTIKIKAVAYWDRKDIKEVIEEVLSEPSEQSIS